MKIVNLCLLCLLFSVHSVQAGWSETEAAVVKSFQIQAAHIIKDKTPEAYQQHWLALISDTEKIQAVLQSCTSSFARVDGTLTEEERKRLILHGNLKILQINTGDCWAVHAVDGFVSELAGYLDTTNGTLLFLWIIPEG